MAFLFNVTLVKYRCSCCTWQPLCQLHFCRRCDQLRCLICLGEEIDGIFCPNCMDSNYLSADASQRKYRCHICNECPFCGNVLVVRSQNNLCHLLCNACQWTSRDAGIPDRPSVTQTESLVWPENLNPIEPDLAKILEGLKELSTHEKLERDRQAQRKKRASNLGVLPNDKYGLQTAYIARKKAMNSRKQESMQAPHQLFASNDVPELNPSVFKDPIDPGRIPSLAQILAQPITGQNGELYQLKTRLVSRRTLRCLSCETIVYKAEYSPKVVKPRLKAFAQDVFPDIKISREVTLTPGHISSIFLTILNNTTTSMDVKISGENVEDDPDCVDTSKFALSLNLGGKEDTLEPKDRKIIHLNSDLFDARSNEVVFISKNKAGLCVECLPSQEISTTNGYAMFKIVFTFAEPVKKKPITCCAKIQLKYKLANEQ